MIDFNNASFMKLKPVPNSDFEAMVAPLFVSGEGILGTYRGMRDGVVFTIKELLQLMSKA